MSFHVAASNGIRQTPPFSVCLCCSRIQIWGTLYIFPSSLFPQIFTFRRKVYYLLKRFWLHKKIHFKRLFRVHSLHVFQPTKLLEGETNKIKYSSAYFYSSQPFEQQYTRLLLPCPGSTFCFRLPLNISLFFLVSIFHFQAWTVKGFRICTCFFPGDLSNCYLFYVNWKRYWFGLFFFSFCWRAPGVESSRILFFFWEITCTKIPIVCSRTAEKIVGFFKIISLLFVSLSLRDFKEKQIE